MSKPVVVLGAGRHALVVLDILLEQGIRVCGILDPDEKKHGKVLMGVPVLGNDDEISRFSTDEIDLVNGVGSVASLRLHKEIYCKMKRKGYHFRDVIHSSAVVSSRASYGEGVQIMAGAIVCAEVSLGENVIVNTRASISCETAVGNHAHIAPGVVVSGGVVLEDEVHVGAGAVILQNIHVGGQCLLGAGAVAIRNLEAHQIYVGIPAREVSGRHE